MRYKTHVYELLLKSNCRHVKLMTYFVWIVSYDKILCFFPLLRWNPCKNKTFNKKGVLRLHLWNSLNLLAMHMQHESNDLSFEVQVNKVSISFDRKEKRETFEWKKLDGRSIGEWVAIPLIRRLENVHCMQPIVTFIRIWHHIGWHAHITMQLRLMIRYLFRPNFQNSNTAWLERFSFHPQSSKPVEMTTHGIFKSEQRSLHPTMQKDTCQRIRIVWQTKSLFISASNWISYLNIYDDENTIRLVLNHLEVELNACRSMYFPFKMCAAPVHYHEMKWGWWAQILTQN